jgi:hypothetical protein
VLPIGGRSTRFTVKRLSQVKLISRDGDLTVESDNTAPLFCSGHPSQRSCKNDASASWTLPAALT